MQDIVGSPKSVYMGGGQSKCFIGRHKYRADQPKIKQKAANRKKSAEQKAVNSKRSAKVFDKISAAVHSPDFGLLTKRQRKQLTELCAQTLSPDGSEVSNLQPKEPSEKSYRPGTAKQSQFQIRMKKDHISMPETQRCLQRWQYRRSSHR